MRRALDYRMSVYPRVGGGNKAAASNTWAICGLSPRGRGKPVIDYACYAGGGSIPAWAGETSAGDLASSSSTVYPRVGGGNV